MSLKDDILSADDIKTAKVEVPEWKQTVTIRAFSAAERDALEIHVVEARKTKSITPNIRAKVVSLIVIDENGNRVFTDEDVEKLGKKSASAIERIFDAHVKLNAMTKDEAKEYEKN